MQVKVRIIRYCLYCESPYKVNPIRIKHNRGLFCSRECSYGYRGDKRRKSDRKWTDEYKRFYSKEYRQKNKEHLRIINRAWKIANFQRVKNNNKLERDKLKKEVFEKYSGGKIKCAECGYDDIRALDLDHVDDNGAGNRRKLFGNRLVAGTTYYRYLRKHDYPMGYQILCRNCNWIKKLNADNKNTVQL